MEPGPEACPPAIVEMIRDADLTTSIGADLFSVAADGTTIECQLYALNAIANRIESASHPGNSAELGDAAATYAHLLTPPQVEAIRQAYLRMPYDPAGALSYFSGLRLNHIDIRAHLRAQFATQLQEDWSFVHPREDRAQTWHHVMYLASLNEPGAMQKLADKLADTKNGNDLTNLLRSFAALKGDDADRVLQSYANDQRRADGVDGPGSGMTVAQTIEQLLAYRN